MVTTRGNGGHVHPGPSAHASELRFASDISFRVRRGIPPDHASASTAQRATPSPPVFSAPGVEPIVLERDSSDEESYGSPYDRSIHRNSKRTRSEEVSLGRTPPPPPSRSQAHTTRPKLTTFHANGKRTRSSGLLDSEREVQSLKVPRTTTTTTPLSASLEQSVLLSVRVPGGSAEAMCSKGRRSTRSPDALKKRSRDSMNALSLYDTPTKGHRGSLLGAQKRPKRG